MTFVALQVSRAAEESSDDARRGTIHLERINGLVYAVVMDSRGIYMSPDWKSAQPFAEGLTRHLVELRRSATDWTRDAVSSERQRVERLSTSIDRFVQLRTELVRRAREVSTAAARQLGDNDENRASRTALNDELKGLAERYQVLAAEASAQVVLSQRVNTAILIVLSLCAVAAVVGGLLLVTRGLLRPLDRVRLVMHRIASGDLDAEISDTERRDEIGAMAHAVAVFRDNARERVRLEQEAGTTRAQEIDRQRLLEQSATDFRTTISDVVATLARETGAMRQVAQTLAIAAETASGKADLAAQASNAAAASAQAVATATDELGASIGEISAQTKRAHSVIADAVDSVRQADRDVAGLASSTQRVDAVVQMIREVAEQTNLLALNATIEAARAGQAGRGFAVVATEVKALATQTAKATHDITLEVASIRDATDAAVRFIRHVSSEIDQIHRLTSAVATAVDQQAMSAREIADNIARAAEGSNDAAANVALLSHASSENKAQAQQVLRGSGDLAAASTELSQAVDMFLAEIAAERTEDAA